MEEQADPVIPIHLPPDIHVKSNEVKLMQVFVQGSNPASVIACSLALHFSHLH